MTTPVYPNPISLFDVNAEFPGALSLQDAYAGGPYVPAGTIGYPYGVATPIPSSGPISLFDFWGASKAPPPAFVFMRAIILADRIATYRFPVTTMVGIRGVTATGNAFRMANNWNAVYSLIDGTQLATGCTATVVIEQQTRAPGGISVSHQPTPSEPYVDIRLDDDGPASTVICQIAITLQLGAGATPGAPYYGSLSDDGVNGVPADQNQLPDTYLCYPPGEEGLRNNGYTTTALDGYTYLMPRNINGNLQSPPPFPNLAPEPRVDHSIPCPGDTGGGGGAGGGGDV